MYAIIAMTTANKRILRSPIMIKRNIIVINPDPFAPLQPFAASDQYKVLP